MPERPILESYVDAVAAAFRTHRFPEKAPLFSELTLGQAYQVQEGFLAKRSLTSGPLVGWKVGCTSPAIRKQFGLKEPISGRLLAGEMRSPEPLISTSEFLECAVEPEFVFRLRRDLSGEPTAEQVMDAIGSVAVGIELHNYRFWQIPATSQELIAFNGIHAGLVIGSEQPFRRRDLRSLLVSVSVNGNVRASGPASEILGGPLQSVKWLAVHAAERGRTLCAGDIIIPGSAVELVRVRSGDVAEARIDDLGTCRATFA